MDIQVVIGPVPAAPVANNDFRPPVVARSELGVNLQHGAATASLPLPGERIPTAAPLPQPPAGSPPPAVNFGGGGALFETAVLVEQLPPPPPLPSAAVELARLGIPSWVPPLSDLHLRDMTV